MTEHFFISQISRLRRRFGDKNFDPEFVKLAAIEVKSMSEMGFQRAVDIWIGSRTSHKPPLLSEFREARLNEEKLKLDGPKGAREFSVPATLISFKNILKEQFGNVATAMEAVELLTLKKRIKDEEDKGPKGAA